MLEDNIVVPNSFEDFRIHEGLHVASGIIQPSIYTLI